MRLARAVEEMLERTLGPGRVRAEASVRMDFDKVNETKEQFDPDGQVTRSTQSVNTNSKTTEANQAVTAQNNLPNADAGGPEQRLAGRPPGGDDQFRNRQDGPHADPRAAADRPDQPRGHGRRRPINPARTASRSGRCAPPRIWNASPRW